MSFGNIRWNRDDSANHLLAQDEPLVRRKQPRESVGLFRKVDAFSPHDQVSVSPNSAGAMTSRIIVICHNTRIGDRVSIASSFQRSRSCSNAFDGSLRPVSCFLFPVSCLLSPVSCLLSPVSCLLSAVSCLLSPGCCLLSPVSCLLSSASPIAPDTRSRQKVWIDLSTYPDRLALTF